MTDRACEHCQKPIPTDAPGGLCPSCLLARVMDDSTPTSTGLPGSTVDAEATFEAALTPELAGRYTTLEGSGQGGMGKVYLVRDSQLGREVALKELLPRGASGSPGSDPDSDDEERVALARFTREARVTAQLQHPAITPVYELGRRVDGSYYYTMKHIRGRTLAQALNEARTLDDRLKLLPNFIALCHAIGFAHSRGVIHRDIKPANVMVGDFGETVVVDWGLAKIKGIVEAAPKNPSENDEAGPTGAVAKAVRPQSQPQPQDDGLQTVHGTALGTPAYMPPEQAQGLIGSLDQRSDIYSLGVVLYEILSGRRPFVGASARDVLTEVLTKPPTPLGRIDPNIPLEYVTVCERAMARDPEKRPASASELAEQVQSVRLRSPKSPLRRFIQGAALATLLLGPLSLILLNLWTDAELARVLERLSAKGFDLRSGPEDYEPRSHSSAELPPGARHAAGTLYALTWEFPQLGDRESELWNRVNALSVRDKSFPWPKGSEKEAQARALSAEVGPVLTALRSTAALPRGGGRAVVKKVMGGSSNPFDIEIPNIAALLSGATLLAQSSYLAQVDGQTDRSLDATTVGLRFASHLEDIPFLIGVVVRATMVDRTLAPLEHAALGQASDATLAPLDGALRETSIGPSLPYAFESEIRSVLFAFHLVRTGRGAEIAAALPGTPDWLTPILVAVYGRGPLRWWGNWDEILHINLMTDCLEATKRPPNEALPDLRRIDNEVKLLASRVHPMLTMFPSLRGTVERVAATDSAIARARIRVALERYQRQRTTFPETLQDLAPEYLDAVPVHVLSGAPFGYTRTSKGYDLTEPRVEPSTSKRP